MRTSPQVSANHYHSISYLDKYRFICLQKQIEIALESGSSKKSLEIGPGPGLFSTILRHFKCDLTTLDYAVDLEPNIIGCLPDIPFASKSFDIVYGFEVLEHLPFVVLDACILEMKRVARERIILSVPDQTFKYPKKVEISLVLGKRKIQKILWKSKFEGLITPAEHYWEIGHKEIDVDSLLRVFIVHNLKVIKTEFVEPHFRFFVLSIN